MGCQRETARKIRQGRRLPSRPQGQPADAGRGPAPVRAEGQDFADTTVEQTQTVDGDPGRIETRKVTVYQDVKWLQDRHAWPGLKSVIKVERRREIGDKIETETRFDLASAVLTALAAAAFVRVHWGIENSLHWVLDMVMRDDESRVRTGNAAANLAIIKHIAYNLIRRLGRGLPSQPPPRRMIFLDPIPLSPSFAFGRPSCRTSPSRTADQGARSAIMVAWVGRKAEATSRRRSNVAAIHRALGATPMILEGFVAFEREVSVVAARSLEGEIVAYDICENEHERHILARTRAPARISAETALDARRIATTVLEALDYVGVLAVELFVTRDWHGREGLVVNEIAPRVHNSGHWTFDGAQTSQFEQHVRAISGWPLGAPTRRGRVEMHNLVGEDAEDWRDILAQPDLCLHLYGKLEIREGRKMGHVTRVFLEPPGEG